MTIELIFTEARQSVEYHQVVIYVQRNQSAEDCSTEVANCCKSQDELSLRI
jgi:hypothetical protein